MIPHGFTLPTGFGLDYRCLARYPLPPYWDNQAQVLGFGDELTRSEELAQFLLTHPYEVTLPVKKGKAPLDPVTWVPGHPWDRSHYGPLRHHDVMVIGKMPYDTDGPTFRYHQTTDAGKLMLKACQDAGMNIRDWYLTTAVKFCTVDGATDKTQINISIPILMQELYLVKPKYLLLLGADAVKAILGDKVTLAQVRSQPVTVNVSDLRQARYQPTAELDTLESIDETDWTHLTAFATLHPAQVLRDVGMQYSLNKDLQTFKTVVENTFNAQYNLAERYDLRRVYDAESLAKIVDEVIESGATDIAFDCEWSGQDFMSGRLRSIQFSWNASTACVVIFANQGDVAAQSELERIKMMNELRRLVKRDGLCIIGHNIRADAKWTHTEEIPLLDGVFWDTMLCDHMLYENAEHGLEACAIKYTDMGRYDYRMAKWVKDNAADIKLNGFKNAPDDELYDYAGCDTIATWRIKQKQVEELAKPENSDVRACYYNVVIPCNLPLHEVETTGLLIDFELMKKMIFAFDTIRIELLCKLRTMTGLPEFNPNSVEQVRAILFNRTWPQVQELWKRAVTDGQDLEPYDRVHFNKIFPEDEEAFAETRPLQNRLMGIEQGEVPVKFSLATPKYRHGLGLVPYKTTGKPSRQWEDLHDSFEVIANASPSTDAESLSELADESPICSVLRDFKIISQVTKAFLRMPDEGETGEAPDDYTTGLAGVIDRDGRIRTTLSQMSETGRQKSSGPNLQNLPKKTEKDLERIIDEYSYCLTAHT